MKRREPDDPIRRAHEDFGAAVRDLNRALSAAVTPAMRRLTVALSRRKTSETAHETAHGGTDDQQ